MPAMDHEHHYVQHILRMPVEDWPKPVQRAFAAVNPAIYVSMHGPSELVISADAKLARWSRFDHLATIDVPALVITARHDTMDRAHMERMAERLPRGRYLYCGEGSHVAMYDDRLRHFAGLVDFVRGCNGRRSFGSSWTPHRSAACEPLLGSRPRA
jgi:proline iminopeptidase